jgi:hypothetical protein
MRMRWAATAAVTAALLAGCGGAPAKFEGTLDGKPFAVRSALFGGPRWLGSNNPPGAGGQLVLTDTPEYCEIARQAREAQARGESVPYPAAEFNTFLLSFRGAGLEPGSLPAGTYPVPSNVGGPTDPLPLSVDGYFGQRAAGELLVLSTYEGTVQLAGGVPLRERTELTGRLSLVFDGLHSLKGEFTATYCEYL